MLLQLRATAPSVTSTKPGQTARYSLTAPLQAHLA